MSYIIQGLHFGYPVTHKGAIYLMTYPYHWLVTSATPFADRIRVGSIVLVPDKQNHYPVYVAHRDTQRESHQIEKYLVSHNHPVKTVTSGKITKRIKKNSYTIKPSNIQGLSNMLTPLYHAYRRLVNQHKISKSPLNRMIYLSKGHYKFLPCDKKYAWWLIK